MTITDLINPESAGFVWRTVSFDRPAWDGEFGEGRVSVPELGEVSLTPESTIVLPGADLGLLKPTLTDPAIIVANGDGRLLYRPVLASDGKSAGYACVFLRPDGHVVVGLDETLPLVEPDDGWVAVAEADNEGNAGRLAVLSCTVSQVPVVVRSGAVDNGRLTTLLGGEMVKSGHGDIPPGARWITVHPHGEGTKGQPVLVMPVSGKKGVYRVIGGAGGRLNMLKLRGIKSQEEYREAVRRKAKEKRAERKAQVERDKELGIHEAKQAARENVRLQKREAERKFIEQVAEAMGWDKSVLDFDTFLERAGVSALSEKDEKKARRLHHQRLLSKAKEAVRLQRDALVEDVDRLKAAGLGRVPLSDERALSVEDLKPVEVGNGPGIQHAFKARAEAAGLTQEKLEEKAAEAKGERGGKEKPAAPASERVREVLDKLPEEALQPKVADAQQAVKLLKSYKALKQVERAAWEANKEIDTSVEEPKAYVLAVDDKVDDASIVQDLEDKARTKVASAFLGEVKEAGGEEAVERHAFDGAHGFLDELGTVFAGGPMIDRSVVDVLGIAGAAQVIAHRIFQDAPDEAEKIAEALEARHTSDGVDKQKAAIEQAEKLQQLAREIQANEAHTLHDVETAAALAQKRDEALYEARRVLGRTLGELEAEAALIKTLRDGAPEHVDVSLGKTPVESAIVQLTAIGLGGDDYQMVREAGNTLVRINQSGLHKLAAGIDSENLARLRRNMAIIKGAEDEDDWLPEGFAKRPDLALDKQPGVAPELAEPMDWSNPDRAQALRDYIGGRFADGDAPADILADVQSADFFAKSGDPKAYQAVLNEVVPAKDENGKPVRVEALSHLFDQYADAFVAKRYGGERSPLNKQVLPVDEVSQEAMFRALADEPAGKLAWVPVGDLSLQDRRHLRDWFYRNVAKESPQQRELREKVEALEAKEPQRFVEDMFGEVSESPEWRAWRNELNAARDKLSQAGLTWERYVKVMGSREKAIEAVQDLIRSRVSDAFAKHYNRLRPEAPLKVGRTVIRHNLDHLDAVDREAMETRLKQQRQLVDALRERVQGKYAPGAVADKLAAAKEKQAALEQAQMGFFSTEELPEAKARELAPDERVTLGHVAEAQLAKMAPVIGRQFKPGEPVKLFHPTMSGPVGSKRQRMIKLIEANKRVIAAAGVGSGKTGIGLGAFADLHSKGKVKKGLFVVPSIVQGQFNAEALRFLEPGRFNWHAQPGASFEERLKAYQDPGTHFAVVTHQSFRDDVVRMAAMKDGISVDEAAEKIAGMDKAQRAAYVRDVLKHHGVNFDYVMADEAHGLLNRQGKEDSLLSQVVEGVTDNAEYYVHASADPVKNDLSEVFSLLQKMDGKRYNDREAFMRRFGGDSEASRAALQRELLRHAYTMSLRPDVNVDRRVEQVELSQAQKDELKRIDRLVARLRLARMRGTVDVEAARALSPAAFEGVPEDQHEEVARNLAKTAGIIKASAQRKVIDAHPQSAKLDKLAEIAKARKGKQGVVFAHTLDAVEKIRQRLEKEGLRVATITGADSSKDKAEKIRRFNPDKGESDLDVIVASDAGATGANLQSGQWLVQYDTPDTAMTHVQRQGRIYRTGQKHDVELVDLVANHEWERRARRRLERKYGLREMLTSPLDGLDDSGLAFHLVKAGVVPPAYVSHVV